MYSKLLLVPFNINNVLIPSCNFHHVTFQHAWSFAKYTHVIQGYIELTT